MDNLRSIVVSYQTSEYGYVRVKLAEVLKSRGITRNYLSKLTGVKYGIIDRYYKAKQIERVDLDFIAKVCFVLGCKDEDLLEYEQTGSAAKIISEDEPK